MLYPKWPLHVLKSEWLATLIVSQPTGQLECLAKLGLALVDSCQATAYWDVTTKDRDALPAVICLSLPMDKWLFPGTWKTFSSHSLPLLGQVIFRIGEMGGGQLQAAELALGAPQSTGLRRQRLVPCCLADLTPLLRAWQRLLPGCSWDLASCL